MIHWNTPTPPEAPFFASIFNYYLSDDLDAYAEYDEKTLDLVKTMPGYLGYESMKHEDRGMFISYWKDMDSIKAWGLHPLHLEAKANGTSAGSSPAGGPVPTGCSKRSTEMIGFFCSSPSPKSCFKISCAFR